MRGKLPSSTESVQLSCRKCSGNTLRVGIDRIMDNISTDVKP